jgi:hypothetical protein
MTAPGFSLVSVPMPWQGLCVHYMTDLSPLLPKIERIGCRRINPKTYRPAERTRVLCPHYRILLGVSYVFRPFP